jgi:hypothetical protein
MILGEKRSNLATPLYPILENASLLSSTTSFVSVPTLAVMPVVMQMISSQSLSTVTKQILRRTMTNIYTLPLKAMEELIE